MPPVADDSRHAIAGEAVAARMQKQALPESVRSEVAGLIALRGLVPQLRSARPRKVREPQPAQAHSPFRGRGMEYAESRPYSPGDDARHIDWRVSARTGQLHSKLFHAERERISAVVYDAGPWMAFGTRGCFKSVQAARLSALFVWDALALGDRVAAVCNLAARNLLPPAGGERGALRLLSQLCRWQPEPRATPAGGVVPLDASLFQLERLVRPGSRLLMTLDAHSLDDAAMRRLQHLRLHHDLMVALLVDPLELSAPRAGSFPIAHAGRTLWLSAQSAADRARWTRQLGEVWRERLDVLHRRGISARAVSTTESPVEALRELMRGSLVEGVKA